MLHRTGDTKDGKPVYGGVFRFYETHGLPLDVVFDILSQRGMMVDWTDFYLSARKAGMKHERVIAKLDESISDSYGPHARDEVVKKLDALK